MLLLLFLSTAITVALSQCFLLWLLPIPPLVLFFLQIAGAHQLWKKLGSQAVPRWGAPADFTRLKTEKGDIKKPIGCQEVAERAGLALEILGEPNETNPYDSRTPVISSWERLRLALVGVTLFPIRTLLLITFGLALFAVCKVSILGLSDAELKARPLTGWRRKVLATPASVIVRAMLFFVMGFLYVPWKGRPAKRDEASIIVCNHRTFLDPLYIGSIFIPSAVGAREHLSAPVVGTIIRASQAITVDRTDPNSKQEVANSIKKRATSPDPWPQILLFPEATTCNGAALIRFMRGAFAPGVPLQPICLSFDDPDFDPSWVPGVDALPLIFRLMCRPINRLSCHFLDVYHPSAEEKADPILFASNVRKEMAKALQVPTTEHSFEDSQLAHVGSMYGLHSDATVLVEVARIKQLLGADLRGIKALLRHFASKSGRSDGTAGEEKFEELFPLAHVDPEKIQAAVAIATEGGGGKSLDFRSFLVAFYALLPSLSETVSAEIFFHSFDARNNDVVPKEVIERSLPAQQNLAQELSGKVTRKEWMELCARHPGIPDLRRLFPKA